MSNSILQDVILRESPLLDSRVVSLFKKRSRSDSVNHIAIGLVLMVSKLFLSVIVHVLYSVCIERTRKEQAEFRVGRGWVDRICTLRQLLEHPYALKRLTIVMFSENSVVCNSIYGSEQWYCLSGDQVLEKCVSVLKELCSQTSGLVRAHDQHSQKFIISFEVWQ